MTLRHHELSLEWFKFFSKLRLYHYGEAFKNKSFVILILIKPSQLSICGKIGLVLPYTHSPLRPFLIFSG